MATATLEEDPGRMTGREYKDALRKLGLTHGGKATIAFLGIDMSTTHRYANNITRVPKPTAMLLRAMIRYGLSPEVIEGINQGTL
ncbi:MAG: hypothetical protein J2P55_00090 [Rhizobiales bacterium]|nr:hypothetical protein [Hyphomicrobiales bacterium]